MLQLLFGAAAAGTVLTASADGNGYAVRGHAQDGNKGNSDHPNHHDGFLSPGRFFTGVIVTANSIHADWIFERRGCGRTRVILPDPDAVYLLLFPASSNAMATHGVSALPPTQTQGRLGEAERYSLSFSCGLATEWQERGEAAATNELMRLLHEKTGRFRCLHEISAIRPMPERLTIE